MGGTGNDVVFVGVDSTRKRSQARAVTSSSAASQLTC